MLMRSLILALLSSWLIGLLPSGVHAQTGKESVMVVHFYGVGVPEDLKRSITSKVTELLGAKYTVIPQSTTDSAIKIDVKEADHPANDPFKGFPVAKKNNATYIFTGLLSKVDNANYDMVGIYLSQPETSIRRSMAYRGKDFASLSAFLPEMMNGFDTAVSSFTQIRKTRADRASQIVNTLSKIQKQILDNMIPIEGGSMRMGAEDLSRYEYPQHNVVISRFYMDRHEVRNLYYAALLTANKPNDDQLKSWIDLTDRRSGIIKVGESYIPKEQMDDYPVILVSFFGAKAYADWLGVKLPTEAQWEYAASNGNERRPFSNHTEVDIPVGVAKATYSFSRGEPLPVTAGQPNPFGLFNMTGNAMEWCSDWLQANYYEESEIQDPAGPVLDDTTEKKRLSLFTHHAIRGGAFNTMELHEIRNERRWWAKPETQFYYLGFRCARQ